LKLAANPKVNFYPVDVSVTSKSHYIGPLASINVWKSSFGESVEEYQWPES